MRDQQHQAPIHIQQLVAERKGALGGGIGANGHQPPLALRSASASFTG